MKQTDILDKHKEEQPVSLGINSHVMYGAPPTLLTPAWLNKLQAQ